MCIRDRPSSDDEVVEGDRAHRAVGRLDVRRGRAGERPPAVDLGDLVLLHEEVDALDAVSYTHLRAHETVLDLVCRLLLEKKNIITYCCLYSTHIT